jgi:hypothetical protein
VQSHSPCRVTFRNKAKLEKTDAAETKPPTVSYCTASVVVSNDEPRAAQGKNTTLDRPFEAATGAFLFVKLNIA